MKILRMITAAILRILLLVPVLLMAVLFEALAKLFSCLNDGLMDISFKLQQVTNSPYYGEWQKQLEKMSDEKRERMLKELMKKNQ